MVLVCALIDLCMIVDYTMFYTLNPKTSRNQCSHATFSRNLTYKPLTWELGKINNLDHGCLCIQTENAGFLEPSGAAFGMIRTLSESYICGLQLPAVTVGDVADN